VPRRKRDTEAGRFHVHAHSVWAAPALFRDDVDRAAFLRELARATARVGWRCVAYCAMTTHYHLLLEVESGVLPEGMHAINFRYAAMFNGRHGMKGHVFGARYDAHRIRDERHLLTAYAYIAANPVKAGMCARADEWPWSSHPGSIGRATPSSFVDSSPVIGCFAGEPEVAAEQLRRFVDPA
jgi:REP element-mobilizing transposase RayT